MKNETKLTISIPKDEHLKLKMQAVSTGQSMRDIIVELLRKSRNEQDNISSVSSKRGINFDTLKIKTKGIKFNRDEANER